MPKTEFVLLPGNRRIRREEYEQFLREFEAAIRNTDGEDNVRNVQKTR